MKEKGDKVREFMDPLPSGGTYPFLLRIADITLAVHSAEPELRLEFPGALKDFLVQRAEPDVSLRLVRADLSDRGWGEVVFDSGSLWRLYRHPRGFLFRFVSPLYGDQPYKAALFDDDFSHGEILLHRGAFDGGLPFYPLEYPLDELLLVHLLARGKGVEVHGCGVVDATGRGHLFVGHSGAGKTTLARLWRTAGAATVLSDDRIILRAMDDTVWIYGTPWHGDGGLAAPLRAPLARLYFPRHWPTNELVPVSASEAAGRLLACSFVPLYSRPSLDFTLALLEQIVHTIPCRELRFAPDPAVVHFLQNRLNSTSHGVCSGATA
jgi:hypothetical protein